MCRCEMYIYLSVYLCRKKAKQIDRLLYILTKWAEINLICEQQVHNLNDNQTIRTPDNSFTFEILNHHAVLCQLSPFIARIHTLYIK